MVLSGIVEFVLSKLTFDTETGILKLGVEPLVITCEYVSSK